MDARLPEDQAARAGVSDGGSHVPSVTAVTSSDLDADSERASASIDPLVGQVVCERYRVEQLLGQGGMGAVYRAVHVHMRKPVALKILHQQMMYFPEAVARFEREAVAAGRIRHPNVAAATDFGRLDDNSFYLALEFVQGRSLRHVLIEAGRLPARRAVNIARQVGEALAAAHALEIVHRDLKPENIMLQTGGPHEDFIKVLDFGLAKITVDDMPSPDGDAPTQLTKMGAVFGTPTYMSPEQAAGGTVDHRTDLYALGVLLYEMLAGHPPFEAEAIVVLLSKHINEPVPRLPPDVDPRLSRLTLRLLEKSPDKRPQSAREVVNELLATRLSIVPPSLTGGGIASRLPPRLRAVMTTSAEYTARVWSRLVIMAVPVARRAWRFVLVKAPPLAALERPIPLGQRHAPLGLLLVVVVAGMLLLGLGASWLSSPATDGEAEAEATAAAQEELEADEEIVADEPVQTKSTLSEAERLRLADIEALPVYKRKVNDWLALAELNAKAGDWVASTAAYRNAIQLDKSQAKNPKVLAALRAAAEQPKSYEAAINVATTLLGAEGMDLLYDLWMSTRDDRKKRLINDTAYKKLEILRLRRPSEALRVRLELEFAKPGECDAVRKTLERAARYADQRSVPALEALHEQDGCGASKTQDCYACLRGTGLLDAALETAKEQAAPQFGDGKYVPAP